MSDNETWNHNSLIQNRCLLLSREYTVGVSSSGRKCSIAAQVPPFFFPVLESFCQSASWSMMTVNLKTTSTEKKEREVRAFFFSKPSYEHTCIHWLPEVKSWKCTFYIEGLICPVKIQNFYYYQRSNRMVLEDHLLFSGSSTVSHQT